MIETIRSDYVLMTLLWTDPTYSYHVTVVPHLPVSYSTSTEAQIRASYNTTYNVSISVSSCGQYTVTAFFKEVFYGELIIVGMLSNNYYDPFIASTNCRNPANLLNDRVRIVGFMEPAVTESSVDFSCPPRMILSGPNASTCMGNGEWEPDPRELNCTGYKIVKSKPQFHTLVHVIILC